MKKVASITPQTELDEPTLRAIADMTNEEFLAMKERLKMSNETIVLKNKPLVDTQKVLNEVTDVKLKKKARLRSVKDLEEEYKRQFGGGQ
jgi:hypothetical protein